MTDRRAYRKEWKNGSKVRKKEVWGRRKKCFKKRVIRNHSKTQAFLCIAKATK